MLFSLFCSFLRIGALTIGGGLAMLPLMQAEAVRRRGWISQEEFMDMLCLSHSFPGLISVNMAVMVGHRQAGLPGSLAAVLGVVFVPFVFIVLMAAHIFSILENPLAARFMKGAMAGVMALIVGVVLNMVQQLFKRRRSMVLLLVFLALALLLNNMLAVIAAALAAGLAAGLLPLPGSMAETRGKVADDHGEDRP